MGTAYGRGNLTNCGKVTWNGQGEVEIPLATSCYGNQDKLQQLWALRLQGFTLRNPPPHKFVLVFFPNNTWQSKETFLAKKQVLNRDVKKTENHPRCWLIKKGIKQLRYSSVTSWNMHLLSTQTIDQPVLPSYTFNKDLIRTIITVAT